MFFFKIWWLPFLSLVLLINPLFSDDSSILQLSPNKKIYSPGDQVFFRVYLPKNGYLYLLNQKSDGTLHLLFPNDEDEMNKMNFGFIRLPSKNVEYEWVIDSNSGEELFYLILSDKLIKFFHKKPILKDQSFSTDNWLRRHTANLLPWEWKIAEAKIRVKQ